LILRTILHKFIREVNKGSSALNLFINRQSKGKFLQYIKLLSFQSAKFILSDDVNGWHFIKLSISITMKTFVLTISIFTLWLFTGSSNVFAQGYQRAGQQGMAVKDGKITGTIIDGANSQTIPYASVAVYNSKDSTLLSGVLSKDNGSFLIEKLPYGKFYLLVTFVGYKKAQGQ